MYCQQQDRIVCCEHYEMCIVSKGTGFCVVSTIRMCIVSSRTGLCWDHYKMCIVSSRTGLCCDHYVVAVGQDVAGLEYLVSGRTKRQALVYDILPSRRKVPESGARSVW